METAPFDTGTRGKRADKAIPTIGLFVRNATDRHLLVDFLQAAGYGVRSGEPAKVALEDWAEISLIVTDEHAARGYEKELLALKHQSGGFFLPLLIALPPQSDSALWLHAGFDDVLRLPLRKAELAARLEMYLYLREQSEESRRLTRQVVQAQEGERQRLARELHDEIGQALTAVNLNLQALQLAIPDVAVSARLQDSLGIIEHTLNQVRDLSLDLHPSILDDLGLVAALKWYLDRQAERAPLVIDLSANVVESDLPAELKSTCFRITQEAITNIVRHAGAKHVRVELRQSKADLELVIRDDGSGFEVVAAQRRAAGGASLGLLGMQERVALIGGRLRIKSARGAGTEIWARFPLAAVAANPSKGRRGEVSRGM